MDPVAKNHLHLLWRPLEHPPAEELCGHRAITPEDFGEAADEYVATVKANPEEHIAFKVFSEDTEFDVEPYKRAVADRLEVG